MNYDKLSAEDIELIAAITQRAVELLKVDQLSTEMDVTCVHLQCPLKLFALYNTDDFNFTHDIIGIAKHLNRETEELEGFFRPRFAA